MPITISFYNPPDTSASEVLVQIVGTSLQGYTSDSIPLIQAAVAAFINSLEIGGTVYTSQLYAPALGVAPGTFVISSLEIKFTGGSYGVTPLVPAFNAQANCNPSTDVSVTIT